MRIQDVHFALKDGRQAVIKSPGEEEVEGTLQYLVQSAGETEFLVRYPEECGRYTPEGEKALFEQKNESPLEAMLVCVVEGKVAGTCEIIFQNRIKTRHRATVAIALLKEFWNQGIGTKMFEELIRLAEDREEVSQIELDFAEGNARARALYEKMGFRITGVRPDALKLKNGTLLNEYMMIRKINRQQKGETRDALV